MPTNAELAKIKGTSWSAEPVGNGTPSEAFLANLRRLGADQELIDVVTGRSKRFRWRRVKV